MSADGFVGNIAGAALDAVIHRDLADRAESFVIKSGHAESGAKFLVELAQILQVNCEGGKLYAVIGDQKFLVAGVPKTRELALDHDCREDGELQLSVSALAKFGAAAVFFDANDSAGAADSKTQRGETFDCFWSKIGLQHSTWSTKTKETPQICKGQRGAKGERRPILAF